MSASTSGQRDLADLLQRLEKGEKITIAQVKKAKTYYQAVVLELQSYKDICEMDKSLRKHENPSTLENDKKLQNELENLRKEKIELTKELEDYKKNQEINRKTNIDAQRQEIEKGAKSLRDENDKLQHEMDKLRKEQNTAVKELEHYKNKEKLERKPAIDVEHREKEKLANKLSEDYDNLRHELENLKKEYSSAIKELEQCKREKFEMKNNSDVEHQQKENFISKLKEDNESLQQDLETLRKELSAASNELMDYRKTSIDREKITVQEQEQSKAMEKLRQQELHLKEENKRLMAQINELRNRLSVVIGHKITAGNPNIADLSDSYRPTNIAERFRQLYDDEWTCAFEEMEKNVTPREEDIIDILAKIVKDVDHFCGRAGKQQFDRLKHNARLVILEHQYQPDGKERQPLKCVSSAVMSQAQDDLADKLLKDFRKCFGILSKTSLIKLFCDVYMSPLLWNSKRIPSSKGLNDFVEKTIELVWMMKVQDPPMEFTWIKVGDRFDKNMFTYYTREGNTVKQCVWPAVVLHLDGPLMSKGVAQGQ